MLSPSRTGDAGCSSINLRNATDSHRVDVAEFRIGARLIRSPEKSAHVLQSSPLATIPGFMFKAECRQPPWSDLASAPLASSGHGFERSHLNRCAGGLPELTRNFD